MCGVSPGAKMCNAKATFSGGKSERRSFCRWLKMRAKGAQGVQKKFGVRASSTDVNESEERKDVQLL